MASFVLRDAFTLINAVDLSNDVAQVTVNMTVEDQDNTAMTALGHTRLAGLRDDSFTFEFIQDFAAGQVDATLAAIIAAGAAVTVEVRPTSAARSATNPGYNGSCILTDYGPIDGSVGDAARTSATFMVSGVITRAVA